MIPLFVCTNWAELKASRSCRRRKENVFSFSEKNSGCRMKKRKTTDLVENIIKKYSIRSSEDWYKLTPQQIRSEVSTKYKLHELLHQKYPNVEWKVYKFQIRPRNFWGTPSFTRQFFLDLAKELNLSKFPEDLYTIQSNYMNWLNIKCLIWKNLEAALYLQFMTLTWIPSSNPFQNMNLSLGYFLLQF